MLLYQWGTYGEVFELNITRQFILGGDSEDENIRRLSFVSFASRPNNQLRSAWFRQRVVSQGRGLGR